MHLSVVFATLFLLAGFVSAQCDRGYELVVRDHHECWCKKDDQYKKHDPKCSVTIYEGKCHAVYPTHTPSHHEHPKRQQLPLNPDDFCPQGEISCPIDLFRRDLGDECVDTSQDLNNCGGCVGRGNGTACEQVPGVAQAQCSEGRCTNLSCLRGWRLDTTNTCVPIAKLR
jgi:hypothetical protein